MVLPPNTDLDTTYALFTIKDKGIMGEGMFLGEALLPLKNILQENLNIDLQVNYGICSIYVLQSHLVKKLTILKR